MMRALRILWRVPDAPVAEPTTVAPCCRAFRCSWRQSASTVSSLSAWPGVGASSASVLRSERGRPGSSASFCTCEEEPLPDAPCDSKNAHVAYILVANADDPEGESFNDGGYAMYIDVTDDNIQPHENANPVITLRMRYDEWKAGRLDARTRSRGES